VLDVCLLLFPIVKVIGDVVERTADILGQEREERGDGRVEPADAQLPVKEDHTALNAVQHVVMLYAEALELGVGMFESDVN